MAKQGVKRQSHDTQETVVSAADRENPEKLTGIALHDLAHRRGLSRTEVARMDDDKIREQLRYMTYRQYEMV